MYKPLVSCLQEETEKALSKAKKEEKDKTKTAVEEVEKVRKRNATPSRGASIYD